MIRLAIIILLCLVTTVSAQEGCTSPNAEEINTIKKLRLAEVKDWSQESGAASEIDMKLTVNNITIKQAYKMGPYILAEHSFDCCFEGYIVLYKKQHGGTLKEITYFNGYNKKGVFIGFEKDKVKKYFKGYIPKKFGELVNCWKN